MKRISPEEFIIGLLTSKKQVTIEVNSLYRFEKISREENLYCGFNFNDLLQFKYLYPSLMNIDSKKLILESSNDKTILALKTIYGISADLREIWEIWEKI